MFRICHALQGAVGGEVEGAPSDPLWAKGVLGGMKWTDYGLRAPRRCNFDLTKSNWQYLVGLGADERVRLAIVTPSGGAAASRGRKGGEVEGGSGRWNEEECRREGATQFQRQIDSKVGGRGGGQSAASTCHADGAAEGGKGGEVGYRAPGGWRKWARLRGGAAPMQVRLGKSKAAVIDEDGDRSAAKNLSRDFEGGDEGGEEACYGVLLTEPGLDKGQSGL